MSDLKVGMTLAWSDTALQHPQFKNYTALIGKGPFTDYEVTIVSPKATVYGDERFRDGMRVPEKQVAAEFRENEARQVGDNQRVKIHYVDSEGHQVSVEFPAYFFVSIAQ